MSSSIHLYINIDITRSKRINQCELKSIVLFVVLVVNRISSLLIESPLNLLYLSHSLCLLGDIWSQFMGMLTMLAS